MRKLKVALVHDYLREYGGAERVVEALTEIFPEAPILTAAYYPKGLGVQNARIKKWDLRVSWFGKWHLPNSLISPFRIFAPLMFESFDLSGFDVVISSSAIYFAKAVITKPASLHIAYIHTPPRYLYGFVTSYNYQKHWWTRIGGALINHFLRIWDFETSQRPDILVANSENVQARIKKFYRRESAVIYPPVDIERIMNHESRIKSEKKYYLSVSRLVRGKGVDVIIKACTKLNLPLKIVGTGPEYENYKLQITNYKLKNVELLGEVEDQELAKLYANAKALIVASEDEDFGITSVEAQAAGTPVIAPRSGGFLETVVDGKTGLLYGNPGQVSVEALVEVLKGFDAAKFKPSDGWENAQKFSKENFKRQILELVEKNLGA